MNDKCLVLGVMRCLIFIACSMDGVLAANASEIVFGSIPSNGHYLKPDNYLMKGKRLKYLL